MSLKTVKRISTQTIALGFFAATTLSFQNCSKVNFANSADSISNLAFNGKVLDAVNVTVKKNQSVTFTAGTLNGSHVGAMSFNKSSASLTFDSGNGKFQILDAAAGKFVYTPNESYVGPDIVAVYAIDPYGNNIPGQINISVGNNLNSIQPALAIRGMSCVTCHSQVSSNIITDYGFGNSWYFDNSSYDSFYLDRANSGSGLGGLATLAMLNNSKIIVPAAPVPAAALSGFNFTSVVTTLSQFVQARFAQGSNNSSTQVVEVAELKISIPTTTRIQQIFENPSANQVYIPDTQKSPSLSGLIYNSANNVFIITNLICDGDLYLNAPAVFADATVQSINGCRIYSTSNVFITSPVISAAYNGSLNYNTQILSTISIWLGTGRLIQNSQFCETLGGKATGWYASNYPKCVNNSGSTSADPNCDTLTERTHHLLIRNTFSRAYPDHDSLTSLLGNPVTGSATGLILNDRARIEAALGKPLYDASCGPTGRNVDANRLMLVAPYVNNRFSGDFSGSTIAESALMSLGTFIYKFDPVFAKVSILSMLDDGELISGQGF